MLLVAIAGSGWDAAPAEGQIRLLERGRRVPAETREGEEHPYAAILQPSEEAMTLLRRAEEGLQRQDWKLTVDSLQRIIDLPGEHVLTSDGRIYESARRHAHRRIASLPHAGLEAYRLVHDGEAAALHARAVAQYDPSLLRMVVDRYLCTTVGETAAITLADWLIDLGRFSEASALLRQLEGLYPDPRLPAWLIPSRLAVCAAGLGQQQNASTVLENLKAATAEVASRPAAQDLAPPPERVDQIAAYIARASRFVGSEGTDNWPIVLGRGSRDGRMPEVEPAFLDYLPRIPLTTNEPKQGRDTLLDYARRRDLLPIRQMVTDGRVLLVKGEAEILAMDADSFTPIWSSRRRHDEVRVEVDNELGQVQMFWRASDSSGKDVDNEMESDPLVRRLLHDGVGSSIGLARNMALTVEWPGDPPPVIPRSASVQIRGGFPGRDPFSAPHPNRVAAYDLGTGELLWRTQDESGEPLEAELEAGSQIEFLAAPIAVDEVLLAPGRINTDLFAILLDPASGRILRRIYLCGTGGGPFNSLYPLDPCVADGVVFIPTGRGVLVALEAATWSIRWIVRYDSAPANIQDMGWHPTPVIAVSDVVLLAPGDSNFLHCFDRGSGELRWKIERDSFSYILSADDRHVWMAGRDLQLVEVETRRRVWRRTAGLPTGRGIRSGDRIYMPTVEGVVGVHAQSGDLLAMEQPVEPPMLGNLLAWDGSLYSVTPFHVSRFPDLNRGYDQALARHQADPADPSRSIRLASLELLKSQPGQALAALQAITADLATTRPRQHGHVVHLRVRAMLELAASGEADPAEALRLLQEARSIAQTPSDAIESALALGDFLHRKEQPVEACLQYLTLALSAEGDEMLAAAAGLERRARSIAVQRVLDAWKGLSADEREPVTQYIAEWLDARAAQNDQAAAVWLAESPGLGDQSHRAELILGVWAAEDLRFEQAEHYFSRVLQHGKSPELLAEAAARLALLYLEPDELHQPAAVAELLDHLEGELAEVELPAVLADAQATAGTGGPGRQSQTTLLSNVVEDRNGAPTTLPSAPLADRLPAARVAAALRPRIEEEALARHREALAAMFLGPPNSQPTFRLQQNARPLIVRGSRTEPLADLFLWLVDRNKVNAHAADDGQLLWWAELKLLGDLAVEPNREMFQQNTLVRLDPTEPARAVLDGQTLVVNSDYGIHAIGLLTGRRLWSRPFNSPPLPNREVSGRDWWIWCHDGFIVSVNGYRQIEVASVSQGERVLWRCSKPSRRWHAVRARGEYVVAVDADLEQVDVFHLSDGRYVGECRFVQDSSPQRRVNVTLYDDVICGPVSSREVVALELAAPGIERWRVNLQSSLAQLFKPAPNLLGIADRTGLIQVIDPANGRKLLETRVEKCAHGIIDGALIDDVLYVYGYQNRVTDQNPNEAEKQQFALAAIRMSTGSVLWQRGELESRTFLSEEVLRASSNAIPVAALLRPGSRAGRGEAPAVQSAAVELMLVDKKTGQEIGEKVLVPLTMDTNAQQISDVQVWPGQVLVAAGSSHVRIPVDGRPATSEQSTQTEALLNRQSGGSAGGPELVARQLPERVTPQQIGETP